MTVPSYDEAQRAWLRELDRHDRALADIITRWPERRAQWIYAVLGSAIALADSFGIDVEDFLAKLRAKYPKPPVLVPPKAGAS